LYYTKKLARIFAEHREIMLYCDYHGHSRRKNIFLYGCSDKAQSAGKDRLKERVLAWMLHQSSTLFSFDNCHFKVHKSKEGTGRVVFWREYKILQSFTMESSLGGGEMISGRMEHFNTRHFKSAGRTFAHCMFWLLEPEQQRFNEAITELKGMFPNEGDNSGESGSDEEGDKKPSERVSTAKQRKKKKQKEPVKKSGTKK
jgi:hypothetical protein